MDNWLALVSWLKPEFKFKRKREKRCVCVLCVSFVDRFIQCMFIEFWPNARHSVKPWVFDGEQKSPQSLPSWDWYYRGSIVMKRSHKQTENNHRGLWYAAGYNSMRDHGGLPNLVRGVRKGFLKWWLTGVELGDTPFKRGQEVHRQRSGQKGGRERVQWPQGWRSCNVFREPREGPLELCFQRQETGGGREGHDHLAPDRSCYGFRSYSQEAIGQGSGAVYLGHVPPPPRLSPTSFHFGSQKTYWRKVKVVQTGDVESISHLTNKWLPCGEHYSRS